jgi:hypothetical protein
MFFNKNQENFKLIVNGNLFLNNEQIKNFLIEKSFKNRIKLSGFLIRLRSELNKFNKNEESNKKLSKEEIINLFPKMVEFFESENENFMFVTINEVEHVIDNLKIDEVIILNKKGKSIFKKRFDNLEEKDLEI